jgi:hypothetical protein
MEGSGGLRESLGLVVLQDVFFEWHLTSVWEDIALCGQVDGSLSAADFEGCFEGDMYELLPLRCVQRNPRCINIHDILVHLPTPTI